MRLCCFRPHVVADAGTCESARKRRRQGNRIGEASDRSLCSLDLQAVVEGRRELAGLLGLPALHAQRVFTEKASTIALEADPGALERAMQTSQLLAEHAANEPQRAVCAGMALFFRRGHRLSLQDVEPVRRLGPDACMDDPQAIEDALVSGVERLSLPDFDRICDLASAYSRASHTMADFVDLVRSNGRHMFFGVQQAARHPVAASGDCPARPPEPPVAVARLGLRGATARQSDGPCPAALQLLNALAAP